MTNTTWEADDIVVVAMTSNLKPADYGFAITSDDLKLGSLMRPSRIRVDKIYTLAQSVVVKTFGRVNETTFDRICDLLRELTAKTLMGRNRHMRIHYLQHVPFEDWETSRAGLSKKGIRYRTHNSTTTIHYRNRKSSTG